MDLSQARWFKSSRSGTATDCVEVAFLTESWFKSSRSGSQSDCVEVAFGERAVGVRDSKDRRGPVLVLGERAWQAFGAGLKAGDYDLR